MTAKEQQHVRQDQKQWPRVPALEDWLLVFQSAEERKQAKEKIFSRYPELEPDSVSHTKDPWLSLRNLTPEQTAVIHELAGKTVKWHGDLCLASFLNCESLPGFKKQTTVKALKAAPPVPAEMVIERVEGSLLNQKVDAIVNAWNRNLIPWWLLVTQGVSGAIKKAGGTEPFKELRKHGVLPLGSARLTQPGRLPFKGIIHVAGINHFWRSSERSVRDSVRNALEIAKKENFSSVAFPAIGAGSCLTLGKMEIPIWGISQKRSLQIIEEEATRSNYKGKVVIVKFRRES